MGADVDVGAYPMSRPERHVLSANLGATRKVRPCEDSVFFNKPILAGWGGAEAPRFPARVPKLPAEYSFHLLHSISKISLSVTSKRVLSSSFPQTMN